MSGVKERHLRKPDGLDDSRTSNNQEMSFNEYSPTKEDANDLNRSQNIESLVAVYRQSSDGANEKNSLITSSAVFIRTLGHKKSEEDLQIDVHAGSIPNRRNSYTKGKNQQISSFQPERNREKARNKKAMSSSQLVKGTVFGRESVSNNNNVIGAEKEKTVRSKS